MTMVWNECFNDPCRIDLLEVARWLLLWLIFEGMSRGLMCDNGGGLLVAIASFPVHMENVLFNQPDDLYTL